MEETTGNTVKWNENSEDTFIQEVIKGKNGRNIGLSNGFKKINKYTNGVLPRTYYLIGADSGVGKTTLSDFMFLINPWLDAKSKGKKIKFLYFSFELSKIDKKAKWVSFFIYLKHKKNIPSQYILGRVEGNPLSDADLEMVKEAYKVVEEMMLDIEFVEGSLPPGKIFTEIIKWYEKKGTVERAASSDPNKFGRILRFIPTDDNEQVVIFIDHIGLVDTGVGQTIKTAMDSLSKHAVMFRNIFAATIVYIQQFSTDLLSLKRQKVDSLPEMKKSSAIIPSRLDFGDSKTTYRDADVALGLVKPFKFDLQSFREWNTGTISSGGLGDFMILLSLLKNRYGRDHMDFPLLVNPIAGIFVEMDHTLNAQAKQKYYDVAAYIASQDELYTSKQQ